VIPPLPRTRARSPDLRRRLRLDDPTLPLGLRGELAAARSLVARGLRIAAHGLRLRDGEIDLLARAGRLWIAVEVKTRTWHPAPERCVTAAQHDRVRRALRQLAPHLWPRPRALRVDVAAVRPLGHGPTPPLEVLWFPGVAEEWPESRTRR
jgi:putative endonuclease